MPRPSSRMALRLCRLLIAGVIFGCSLLISVSSWAASRVPDSNEFLSSLDPSFQSLLESSYLGHAAELPAAGEPAFVLEKYIKLSSHDFQGKNLDDAIVLWESMVSEFSGSRYALAGLASLYRKKASIEGGAYTNLAADAFIRASNAGLDQGRILYTREISELLVELRDKRRLKEVFRSLLARGGKAKDGERYLALVDYGDGLARFQDDAAWGFFEEAIASHPKNDLEAFNRYAEDLLVNGRARQALVVLERLSEGQRVQRVLPAYLRQKALRQLGLDIGSADREVEKIEKRFAAGAAGVVLSRDDKAILPGSKFSHSNATDDCRSAANASNTTCDGSGNCVYNYVNNLAEILYNEARSESVGAQDIVGWTVRDRSLQGVSCDAYVGGVNYGTCRSTQPCTDPNHCDLSRWYCCVEHGNTFSVGTSQSQFNDAHVSVSNLVSSGVFYQALYVINGWVPEVTSSFTPPGTSGCTFSCSGPWCSSGSNITDAAPLGPMEYLGNNYCAQAQTCKTYLGNVCGGNTRASSCSSGGTGDNYFWNKKN